MQRFMRLAVITAAAALIPFHVAQAEGDGLGPFVRGGVALGWAVTDEGLIGNTVSNGVNAGFEVGGGYRFAPAIAAEGNLTFITGGDVTFGGAATTATTQAIAFTVGVKLYPFHLTADDATSTFQPYLRAAIGGGSAELKDAGPFTGSEGVFLGRFGGGLEVMLTDRLGVYGEGDYYVTNKDLVTGVGTVGFGGVLKF